MKKVVICLVAIIMIFLVGCKDKEKSNGNSDVNLPQSNGTYIPGYSGNTSTYGSGDFGNQGSTEKQENDYTTNEKLPLLNSGDINTKEYFAQIENMPRYTIVMESYGGIGKIKHKIVKDSSKKASYYEVNLGYAKIITLSLEDGSYTLHNETEKYSKISDEGYSESGEISNIFTAARNLGEVKKVGDIKYGGKKCFYEEYEVEGGKATYIYDDYSIIAIKNEYDGTTQVVDFISIEYVADENLLKIPDNYTPSSTTSIF